MNIPLFTAFSSISGLLFPLDYIKIFRYNFVIFKGGELNAHHQVMWRISATVTTTSSFCHQYGEPVFITKNGKGDLAVWVRNPAEQLLGRFELYGLLLEGMDDIKAGYTCPSPRLCLTSERGEKDEVSITRAAVRLEQRRRLHEFVLLNLRLRMIFSMRREQDRDLWLPQS